MDDYQVIRPQKGFQEKVLSNPADIVICGGSAGGGKTAVLLIDAARWNFIDGYGAVIFRRSYPEIVMQDGLWDQSKKFYEPIGGKSNETSLRWTFVNGSRVSFSHLQYEKNLYDHQGAQYAFIGFDELTHFSKKEFMYLLSRNRSVCGVDPVIRATCNPDPESWVAEFIAWFIDQDTGYPIEERQGVVRYFTTDNGNYVWGDTAQEVIDKCPHLFRTSDIIKTGIDIKTLVKSMTFIAGNIYENKILLSADPRYLGNLMALDEEEKLRLLEGNWKLNLDARELFPILKIKDIFSNIVPEVGEYAITCDHARFGRDLCVVFTWRGWAVKRIDILPISNSNDVVFVIQNARRLYRPIPVSRILVDQDGIGVHDILGCKVFQGNAAAEPLLSDMSSDYRNKKTQNYYKAAEKVEAGVVAVDLNEVYLWNKLPNNRLDNPIRIKQITIKATTHSVEDLIIADLRTVKKFKQDNDGKKMITPKEQQKNAIGGRSPDFGDNFMMNAEFEWIAQPQYIRKR